ncbi:hypothetical protein I310_02330 [Cryptococcus deuterogattii CA1014]|nr:hypothetical protein I310_02330 [Cryptococcus deuterogattii CA1014]
MDETGMCSATQECADPVACSLHIHLIALLHKTRMPQLAVVEKGKIDVVPPAILHCRSVSTTTAESATSRVMAESATSRVIHTRSHAISDKATPIVSLTPSKPSTPIPSTFVKGLHLDPCEAAYIIASLTMTLKTEESDLRLCLLQGLAYMIGSHDTCGSVRGYFGHGRRYSSAIILDGETILFETTDEGDKLPSLGGIKELLHFMGDKTLPRCYGTYDKPDVKAFEDACSFALMGLRMLLDLPLEERLCRLKAPSGESWESLMNELQMRVMEVKYPKTREDVEYMVDIICPEVTKKNEQFRLYKEVAVLDTFDAAILSQRTTTERADNAKSQEEDKAEVTQGMKTRKTKAKKISLPEAGAYELNTRFRDSSPSDGRGGRAMGREASRCVGGSHQLDRSGRKRTAPSPEDDGNQKQFKSNKNKEDDLNSVSVDSADAIPLSITPPDILSKWLLDSFTNEPCASKAGLEMCPGVNSSPENSKLHFSVPGFVEEEEINPPASELVDENEPDIPISQRGDEEDIIDIMERQEEERKLYLALSSILEQRGFRFLLGGQKVFQAVLKELTDQCSG